MDKIIPICLDCPDAEIQHDLLDKTRSVPVGCKRMTYKQWLRGYKSEHPGGQPYQHRCPRFR